MRIPHVVTITPEDTQNCTQNLVAKHVGKGGAKIAGKVVGAAHRTVEGNADKYVGLAKEAMKKRIRKSNKAEPELDTPNISKDSSPDASLASFSAFRSSTRKVDSVLMPQNDHERDIELSSSILNLTPPSTLDSFSSIAKTPVNTTHQDDLESTILSAELSPPFEPLASLGFADYAKQVTITSTPQIADIIYQLDKEGYFHPRNIIRLPVQLDMQLRMQRLIMPSGSSPVEQFQGGGGPGCMVNFNMSREAQDAAEKANKDCADSADKKSKFRKKLL